MKVHKFSPSQPLDHYTFSIIAGGLMTILCMYYHQTYTGLLRRRWNPLITQPNMVMLFLSIFQKIFLRCEIWPYIDLYAPLYLILIYVILLYVEGQSIMVICQAFLFRAITIILEAFSYSSDNFHPCCLRIPLFLHPSAKMELSKTLCIFVLYNQNGPPILLMVISCQTILDLTSRYNGPNIPKLSRNITKSKTYSATV